MRIYLDLDSRRLLTTPTRPLTSLEFKRRDNDSIELQFLRDAVVQELPAGTTARIGIKPAADYDAAFLAAATLTQSGTGTATFYYGELNLNTAAIATAFADEPVFISAMLEVEWVTADVVSSSKTLASTIQNDVIRGDEGDPAELPIFYTAETSDFLATQAQAESGTDNVSWMSPLRTAQAIAALGGSGAGGGVSSYNDLTDIPTEFPPAAHAHELADVTGLETALDGKAATTHTHTIGEVTGLQDELDALAEGGGGGGVSSYNDLTDVPSTFPPEAHTHAISEVTGLQTAIDGKAAATHTHAIADTTGLQAALDGKQAAGSYVTTSGGITAIALVATMPASPDANTLYVVTA